HGSQDDSANRNTRKMSRDLEETAKNAVSKGKGNSVTRVIIQLRQTSLSDSDLQDKLGRHGAKLKNRFSHIPVLTADVPVSRLDEMSQDDDIAYISPDRPVVSHGHVETTVAAGEDDARTEVSGFTSLNGTGVGIAVLDSGIDDTHNLIK